MHHCFSNLDHTNEPAVITSDVQWLLKTFFHKRLYLKT